MVTSVVGEDIFSEGLVDMTHIPTACGIMHLVAITDWHSRNVPYRRVSNSLDSAYGVEALRKAKARLAAPVAFNTDPSARFTSDALTGVPKDHKIRIGMAGRSRVQDNIFIGRLYWPLNDPYPFLWSFANGAGLCE
jgi:transposase InsO family protein